MDKIIFNRIFLITTLLAAFSVQADTLITSRTYDLFTETLGKETAKVHNDKIRLERPGIGKGRFQIIDTAEKTIYMVDPADGSVITQELNKKSSYNDLATLEEKGEGPVLTSSKQRTTHYIFKAGDIECNHVYIAATENPDMKIFLEKFTMLPIKLSGLTVSADEKACQKAARDAAKIIKQIGVPLMIRGMNDKEELFVIDGIKTDSFPDDLFEIPNKQNSKSMEDIMGNALAQIAYEKFTQDLEKQKIPEAEKEKIRKEAKAAHEKGEFIDYAKTMAKKEQTGKSKKLTDTNFKNIPPEQIIEFIQKNKNEKPVFIFFSSQDRGCGPCQSANKTLIEIAKQNHDKIDFVAVDFYPWTQINDYKEIISRTGLGGVPHSLIIYKQKIISRISGKQNPALFQRNIKEVLADTENDNYLERFGNHTQKGSIYFMSASDSGKKYFNKYLKKVAYKAMAIALNDKGNWNADFQSGFLSQKTINAYALKKCEKNKIKRNIKKRCKLYMVGDHYVYGKTSAQIDEITARIRDQETPLDEDLKKFEAKNNYKSFALAESPEGWWVSSWVYGKKTQEEADKSVLQNCEQRKKKKKISGECKIIARGEEAASKKDPTPASGSAEKPGRSPESLSIEHLAGYKISAGSLDGDDHPIYQTKYNAIEFGCNSDATFEMASNKHGSHKDKGSYRANEDEIMFIDEEDLRNYIVGLADKKVVVGKSSFEGPQGMPVKQITKVRDCR